MLIVISPAKKLDLSSQDLVTKFTQPDFLNDSQILVDQLRKKSAKALCKLMGISEKLGQLNAERFSTWSTPFDADSAKPALLMFKGDVYLGMQPEEFSQRDFDYAQKHLRILSGLYGVLRPLDLIQAYRLEMGTQFKNVRGKNLYEFWGTQLTESINTVLSKDKPKVLVNLASNEYFSSLQPADIDGKIVTPAFREAKNGKFKMLSFFAKKARGAMASWIIRNRIKNVDELKTFNEDGYEFNSELSQGNDLVFTRGTI